MSNEQDLLQRASKIETQALAEIYDSYSPGIYRYAMRLLGDMTLAEDCVAETFARFLKSLQEQRGPRNNLKAYLYRIAHNWIVDHYRKDKETLEPVITPAHPPFQREQCLSHGHGVSPFCAVAQPQIHSAAPGRSSGARLPHDALSNRPDRSTQVVGVQGSG